jgi:hypothetical protein
MEIIKIIAVAVVFAVAIWVLYTLVKMSDEAKEKRNDEAPYKVEPPKSTEQMAVSDTWETVPPADHFEPYCKPKRKYTKRSKYWSSPKVKTKMSKARKARKPSKSK